ncbi:MAG TPA: hypothetical protein VF586_07270 [Pyrinomonadaceae bacterium]
MGYEDVFERFEAWRVPYVVVGGAAVALHGHERETRDLDVVVELSPEATRRATEALVSLGFVPALPLPLEMLTVQRFTDAAGREVDVFARFRLPFEELWSAAEHLGAAGRPVRVCSLAHLIRMKRLDGRPRDLRDVEALLAGKGEGAEESGQGQ